MRIAANRSTISTPDTAPEPSLKSAGASFSEVLTGASAQPSNGTGIPAVNSAPQQDSDAADSHDQQNISAKAHLPAEGDLLWSNLLPVASHSKTVPASQPAVASNGGGTNRTAGGDLKTPTAPAPPTVSTTSPITVSQVEIVPVSTLPVPSPSSSVQGESRGYTESNAPTITAGDAQTATHSSAVRALSAAGAGQNQMAVQDIKSAANIFNLPPDSAIEANQPALSTEHGATVQNNEQNQSTSLGMRFAAEFLSASHDPTTQPDQPKDSSAGLLTNNTNTAQQITSAIALAQDNISFPNLYALPNPPSATNSVQTSKASSIGLSGATTGTSAPGAAVNGPPTSTSTQTGDSAHNTQSSFQNNAAAEHVQGQTAPNQPAPQIQTNPASATAQIPVIAAHSPSHDGLAAHIGGDASVDTARANQGLPQPEINDSAPASGINAASVIQKMSETEMRVGMHSAEFGEISIRTSVSQQQMLAQISVDHSDLSQAISAHIPTIEAKLGGELGIRASVQVSQSGMQFSGEHNSSPQREQQALARPAAIEGLASTAEVDTVPPHVAAIAGDIYRLDIRA